VYDVHAFDIDGDEPPGWPKFTNGWMVGSAAVGDVDGDGLLEVVAVTREGNLFVWNADGDECGPILWRRYHHDEWGTGNYHADTRPPASLRADDVAIASSAEGRVELTLAAVPGDDLFCGDAQLDVRFAETPIESAADFDAATAATVETAPAAGRSAGTLVATSDQWSDTRVHLAMVAVDDAGNRSAVVDLGTLDSRRSDSDDSCSIARPNSIGAWPLLIGLFGWVLVSRRGRRV
jgi:hypothetical protein